RHEYLGGLSIVPVEQIFLIAFIPQSLLAHAPEKWGRSDFRRPLCLQILSDGNPIRTIESLLKQGDDSLDPRWVEPWFSNLEPSRLWDGHLPEAILASFRSLGLKVGTPDHKAFFAQIGTPAPYLHYFLVFELRS